MPKRAMTVRAGNLASMKGGGFTAAMIRTFVRRYGVDMREALNPDITSYTTFNAFFTRALRPDARPLAAADLICPVDGAISQFGSMDGKQIFQAKGHHYLTTALIGGNEALATQFDHGSFATLYLSPRDYHRVHMPCAGRLLRMLHVPGDLFSVNPATARGVPGLFARNERVVCIFDTTRGPFVLVLVGATIVGSVATVDLRKRNHRFEAGRRDGSLPARLDRGDAFPEELAEIQPRMGTRARRPPRRNDGELLKSRE